LRGSEFLVLGSRKGQTSRIEDFLVNVAGVNDNPFGPIGKIKISIAGKDTGAKEVEPKKVYDFHVRLRLPAKLKP
jgi:hypothetical protein